MPDKIHLFTNPLHSEPVRVVNAVRLVLLAGVTFGLSLSDVQIVASMAALEAVLTAFTRSRVTPAPVSDDAGRTDLVGVLWTVTLVLVIIALLRYLGVL